MLGRNFRRVGFQPRLDPSLQTGAFLRAVTADEFAPFDERVAAHRGLAADISSREWSIAVRRF